MIKKPTIIITSGGRTGTLFFTKLFNNFENIASVHEPENIDIKNIKKFGFINSVLRKIQGKWGITSISNNRMLNKLSIIRASDELIKQRKKYIEGFKKNLYVESSYHYYGLLDVLPLSFKTHKAIFIIRDPRSWVASHMNKKEFYHLSNPHTWFKTRISPRKVNDIKYLKIWKKMDRFEKLCWAWNYINNYAIGSIKKNPNAKLFFFEDLFISEKKVENMSRLINFILDLKNVKISRPKKLNEIIKKSLSRKVNKPQSYNFPKWKKWTPEQAKTLYKICGPLMEKLEYGNEMEWKKLINS